MKTLWKKLCAFCQRNKKTIVTFLVILLGVVAVSALTAGILAAFDIIYFEGLDPKFNTALFEDFKNEWYGALLFVLLQTVLSMLLCVIPGISMAFIILSQTVLYPVAWQSFLLCFVSVVTASTSMYLIGRFGGYALCCKLLGKEDCDHALTLLRNKGTFFFPFMMLFPFFPDEALTMIAGTTRMKLSWFLPSIFLARGIGIATIVFGVSFIPFEHLTSPWHWVLFVLAVAVLVVAVLLGARRFSRYMEGRGKDQTEEK